MPYFVKQLLYFSFLYDIIIVAERRGENMDEPKLVRFLQDFHEISGMTVCILDKKFRYIVSANKGRAEFCEAIHRDSFCLNACIKSDREFLLRAMSEKRTVSFICPFGFFEAVAPIIKNGEIIAYIFLGAGIEAAANIDERILEGTLRLLPSADEEYIKACIKSVPHHSRDKLDAIVNMLDILANHIGQSGYLSDEAQSLGEAVKKYIDDNLSKKITLSDISWNLHRSTVSLTEHFKSEFGITIMEYVQKKRMEKAERMLCDGNEPITAISSACGFTDVEYFSRTFKKFHGLPPKKWRTTHSDRQ